MFWKPPASVEAPTLGVRKLTKRVLRAAEESANKLGEQRADPVRNSCGLTENGVKCLGFLYLLLHKKVLACRVTAH